MVGLTPAFKGIEKKRQPDAHKGKQRGVIQLLMEDENAEEEGAGRRNILQEAQCHQPHMAGGVGEKDHRQGRDRPRGEKQKPFPQLRLEQKALAMPVEPRYTAEGQGRKHHRFHKKPGQGLHGNRLADVAVERKGEGQRQAKPGKAVLPPKAPQNTRRRDADGHALQACGALVQEKEADQHVDQRVNIVAEACFEDLPRAYRPDVQKPVAAHRARTCKHDQGYFPVARRRCDLVPPPGQKDHWQQGHEGKDDAVAQDFQRRHGVQHTPEQNQKTPDEERAKPRQKAEDIAVPGCHGSESHTPSTPFSHTRQPPCKTGWLSGYVPMGSRLTIKGTGEQIGNGLTPVGFKETGSRRGEVAVLDNGLFHLRPYVVDPAEPAVLILIEHQKGLVADFGEFGAPARAALDGMVRLNVTDDHHFLPAAHLPANGLQHLAEQGGLGEFPTHKAGNIGQADVLERELFGGKHAHAAFAFDLMPVKAVIDFFDTPSLGLSAEKLLGTGGPAAEKDALFRVQHGCSLVVRHATA